MTIQINLETRRGGDESLEELARSCPGNDAAFEVLVRRCYDRITRWAFVATGDLDDADDVVQETLLRMYRSLGQFRGDSLFLSWVYRITQSAAADLNRRRASRLRNLLRFSLQGQTHQESAPSIIGRMETDRRVALVRAFWKELPPGQRMIFDLADLQGFTPAEIAEMHQMNAVTVRAHLFKARRTIRRRLLAPPPESLEEEA